MSIENNDWVEDLLKGLLKIEPMSEFEIRKFEKLIDRQAEEFKKSKLGSRFKIPASIAASVAIAFGAVLLLTNHGNVVLPGGDVIKPIAPQPSDASTQKSAPANSLSTTPEPKKPSNQGKSQTGNLSPQVYGNSNTSDGQDGTVPKFETNLDYSTDLLKIKKLVTLGEKPGLISSLTNAVQQCAIKQGISASLLAFDKAYFQGQRVDAYFSGENKNNFKIFLVDSDCALVSEL